MTNLRLVSVLEVATVAGAIAGSALAGYLRATVLEILFATVLLILAIPMALGRETATTALPSESVTSTRESTKTRSPIGVRPLASTWYALVPG